MPTVQQVEGIRVLNSTKSLNLNRRKLKDAKEKSDIVMSIELEKLWDEKYRNEMEWKLPDSIVQNKTADEMRRELKREEEGS